jgi:hypothetical protein
MLLARGHPFVFIFSVTLLNSFTLLRSFFKQALFFLYFFFLVQSHAQMDIPVLFVYSSFSIFACGRRFLLMLIFQKKKIP